MKQELLEKLREEIQRRNSNLVLKIDYMLELLVRTQIKGNKHKQFLEIINLYNQTIKDSDSNIENLMRKLEETDNGN